VQSKLQHALTIEHPAAGHYRDFDGNVVSPEPGDMDDGDYWRGQAAAQQARPPTKERPEQRSI
jgi:hypothetical protein